MFELKVGEQSIGLDSNACLRNRDDWNISLCEVMAKQEGIAKLTIAHKAIINGFRLLNNRTENMLMTLVLLVIIVRTSNRFKRLFPGGLKQAIRLSGHKIPRWL